MSQRTPLTLDCLISEAPICVRHFIGRYIKYPPVTGQVFHKVIGVVYSKGIRFYILDELHLEGGNIIDIHQVMDSDNRIGFELKEEPKKCQP